ncbi:MAG TPA: heparan-alpha-glucosaminide N-acetyltransferase domain-containing protein [Terriglobales bacterium]|nr:heparan-alpha-glucosaminide N-acetyltransferase domain-containing protein [Terriglobales bacterium]
MPGGPASRLGYIDWLRGLACLLMFQTHCYDAWLGGAARNSQVYVWSQLLGTFPAPLFLFLAGISFALVVDKLLRKGATPAQIAKKTIMRGAEILALGILFRLQEFVIAWGWAPWSDLFRVDILNCIGVSLMLLGLLCWGALTLSSDKSNGVPAPTNDDQNNWHYTPLIAAAILVTAAISTLTPLLWTSWRPSSLPWEFESYISEAVNLAHPHSSMFPIFPWAGFAFAGLALGFILINPSTKKLGAYVFGAAGACGVAFILLSKFFDSRAWQLYPVYNYWHTSPEFFTLRVGMLLLLVLSAYAWCRWGPGQMGFSPLIQLGQTSLLVYWVHLEFVYGKFTILPHRGTSVPAASAGLITIFLAMLLLSWLRTTLRSLKFYKATVKPLPS